MTDYLQEPFAQDVAYVIKNVPALRAHVEGRLARMYNISALNEDRNADRNKRPRTATNCTMFPGAIVCSLLRSDLCALTDSRNNYVALEKTDGVRYLLLLTTLERVPYAILIDRKMEMRIVNLDISLPLFEEEALFDGELAQNIENGLFTFLIFDLIHTGVRGPNGEKFHRDVPYTQRMKQANNIVRTMWRKQVTTEAQYTVYSEADKPAPTIKNTFSLKVKRYVPLSEFAETFKQVFEKNTWSHHGYAIDGFVFVKSRQRVEPFRNEEQFKYKPADRQTVDVQLLRSKTGQEYELLIKNTRNCPQFYDKVVMCAQNVAFIAQNQGEIQRFEQEKRNFIVECSWSAEQRCWLLKIPRLDKQTPNALNTIDQTKKNIEENIKLDELVQRFRGTNQPVRQPTAQLLQESLSPPSQTSAKGCFIHPSRIQNIVTTTEYDPVQNTRVTLREAQSVLEHGLPQIFSPEAINDCECAYCLPQPIQVPTFSSEDLERLLEHAKALNASKV